MSLGFAWACFLHLFAALSLSRDFLTQLLVLRTVEAPTDADIGSSEVLPKLVFAFLPWGALLLASQFLRMLTAALVARLVGLAKSTTHVSSALSTGIFNGLAI